ncbi:MAG: phosphoenolpyruvate--protein phosphotransferase [Pirellulaceae bacterium]|nr:phosphoenolpyruvate--protein phosphotransferase [Pirellulaceae bacterium]
MILQGVAVSPGVASGPAQVLDGRLSLHEAALVVSTQPPSQELERFHAARGRALAQLVSVRRHLASRGRSDDAAMFSTHAALLRDRTLLEPIEQRIQAGGCSAEAAVANAAFALERQFLASASSLLQERVADILDIGQRLVRCLRGLPELELADHGVVVAPSLSPSELVRAAHQGAIAVAVESCGRKSHTAILARGFGLPLVAGLENLLESISHGALVIVDGETGRVLVEPTAEERRQVDDRRPAAAGPATALTANDATTVDGQRVTVLLNISDTSEAAAVAQLQADGVGLYRTEFLYIDRSSWPSWEESFQQYSAVSQAIGDRELNIRLADFGAEKCPAYADIPINRNPSLGIRGVRLLLSRDDILGPQVAAIARLALDRPLTVLLPMIDTLDTLLLVKERVGRHAGCRRVDELPFRLGMMVEVPSAALNIEDLLEHVDCISLGLNDLTQYVLAADRDDELVEPFHDPLQPAVLRLVHRVIDQAGQRGKPVTMCGELAGDPLLLRLLLGFGARRFSVSRSHFHQTVAWIRQQSLGDLQRLAAEALRLGTGRAVRERVAASAGQISRYP